MLLQHPEADREELDKLTGNVHRVQGKMGVYTSLFISLSQFGGSSKENLLLGFGPGMTPSSLHVNRD